MTRKIALTSRALAALLLLFASLFNAGYAPAERATAEPADTNVFAAAGVTATASGWASADTTPERAIDGGTASGKWVSEGREALPEANEPFWLKIDVGAEATVRQFAVSHAGAAGFNTKDFTIEISDDDLNWTSAVSVTGNTYGTTVHELETPVTARYFKLQITDPGAADADTGKYAAQIYEFQASGFLTDAAVPVTGISLDKNALTLAPGETARLSAAVAPENATSPGYDWSSDDPAIATVSDDGLVTAVGPGTTGITATTVDGGFKASALATVTASDGKTELIGKNADWTYLDNGTDPGAGWREPDFDDSAWKSDPAPLGYASSGKGLELSTWIGYGPDSGNKYITTYFRKEFEVEDAEKIKALAATLIRDDGAVIYLNGQEVHRVNMPAGAITAGTLAVEAVADERREEPFEIDASLLKEGANVLAAEVHQNARTSSDLFFSLELEGSETAPPASDKNQGLLGEYYTGTESFDFGDYKSTAIDPQINFPNLEPMLQSRVGRSDDANVRWTGQIMPPKTDAYTFYMTGDNGFRLWIDGQLVIDHWVNDWDKEQTSSPVTLEGGVKYSFKVEYFEDNGGSNLYLRWSTPTLNKEIVPASAFFLPSGYNGPVSGAVAADGRTATLAMMSDLAELPAGIIDHLTVTADDKGVRVLGAEPGGNPSVLALKLGDAITPNQVVNIAYDGEAGLRYDGGDTVRSFAFGPVNYSEVVDYTPMAIAMTFHENAKTNRAFAWYTSYQMPENAPSDAKDSIVEIVPAGQDFDSAEMMRFVGHPKDTRILNLNITSSTKGSFISHKVVADGLKPGTAYKYRVGSEGNWSETGRFTTESDNENEFEFLYMTDSQGSNSKDYEVWANTLREGLEDYPDAKFMVMTGDQVDAGSLESQWLDYFDKPQDMLMNLPLMAAVGNHEGPYNDNYYYHFNYPNDSIEDPLPPGSVYAFDYGDAHIMVLNTMDMGWDDRQRESFKQEIEWLRKEVAETDKKWKVVAFHKAIYSVGGHATDRDILELRQMLYPVFDELGIDVVLQGHDHTFMRSYQMYNDKPVTDVKTDENGRALNPGGTLYMINNSAATKFYDVKDGVDRYYAAKYEQPRVAIYSGIRMTEDSLTIDSYKSGEDAPFDTYSIVRNDGKPNPVEGLSASRTEEGKTKLSWTKPEDRSAEDPVRGFRIYETSGKMSVNWSVYVPAREGMNDYEYVVDNAAYGEAYEFAVKAVDGRDNSEASLVSLGTPAPTAPVVDDEHNTFGWTNVPGYDEPSEYEYSVDGGTTWKPATANPQPVGNADYAAGAVMVRVKANESSGVAAGEPLASDKPFTVNGTKLTYAISGTMKRDGQLQVDVTVEKLAEYEGEAFAVFELLNGNTPVLINAIPLRRDKLSLSQYFNVSGADYRVKVFVFDEFNGDLNVPLPLAEPVTFQ